MKKIMLFFLILSTLVFSENYKKVKVYISNKAEIVELQRIGIPLDDAYQNRDGSLDMFLNEAEFKSLNNTSINYNVIIDNWAKYYTEQQEESSNNFSLSKNISQFNVNGFTKGSMGGFYTLAEVWQKIDEMISLYPNLISNKDSIGASDEGRPIYAVRISDNPNINEDEPEVLYTALIHAREPESMMQMIYYMFYLLENYGTDAEATYLIDNREMYFIPVINPDGYVYNESTNPNGGGMWRKNRQYNIDGTYGVDLNRNFGYEWGYDDDGSSGSPFSNTYRGTAGFSEPETETIRQYCIEHNFSLALNYHTYSNLLITPWGYIPEPTPDSVFYSEIATDMTQYNNYTWGYSAEIIYAVNGDSDDWFYGEQTEKNKIYAMTPEVGNSDDGFWPDEDRIIPLAEENVYPNLYLAWVAGGFVNTLGVSYDKEHYVASETGYIDLTIKNKGLEDIDNIITTVTISDNATLVSGASFDVGNISTRTSETINNAVEFLVNDSTLAGDFVFVNFNYYSSELLLSSDTYSFIVGSPQTIYFDSLSTLDNWIAKTNTAKNWEITSNTFYSTPSSATDSKIGNYLSNSESVLTSSAIDLFSLSNTFLKFKTKYNIESGWDYGQVLISTDSINWQPIGGGSSKLGSGSFQPSNELIYDGNQSDWITEIINLNEYSGNQIYLKFELNSDEYLEEDGWYIDDVEIFEYTNNAVSVNEKIELPTAYSLSQNYPNPFNPSTTIKYSIPVVVALNATFTNVQLKVYDLLGREVATLVNEKQSAGNYEVIFTAANLTSGIYFYRLISGDYFESRKMLLLK